MPTDGRTTLAEITPTRDGAWPRQATAAVNRDVFEGSRVFDPGGVMALACCWIRDAEQGDFAGE